MLGDAAGDGPVFRTIGKASVPAMQEVCVAWIVERGARGTHCSVRAS